MISVFPEGKSDEKYPENSRIFLTNPKEEELSEVATALNAEKSLLLSALDENALSRIHFNDITAIYADIPYSSAHSDRIIYRTAPVGIFLIHSYFVIVSYRPFDLFQKVNSDEKLKNLNNMDLLLFLLYEITLTYLIYLKDFYQKTEMLEKQLKKNLNNNGIFQLMEYQRSLTDLSTSIKGLKRLLIKIDEHQFTTRQDNLLEDALVAAEQASEMADIYSEDLDALIDAFGSVISNNLNQIMKILTSLTLIIAIPTMVAGIYGMNVANIPFATHPYAFWAILGGSGIVSVVVGILFYFKKML